MRVSHADVIDPTTQTRYVCRQQQTPWSKEAYRQEGRPCSLGFRVPPKFKQHVIET
jgi:hypothetical protein